VLCGPRYSEDSKELIEGHNPSLCGKIKRNRRCSERKSVEKVKNGKVTIATSNGLERAELPAYSLLFTVPEIAAKCLDFCNPLWEEKLRGIIRLSHMRCEEIHC